MSDWTGVCFLWRNAPIRGKLAAGDDEGVRMRMIGCDACVRDESPCLMRPPFLFLLFGFRRWKTYIWWGHVRGKRGFFAGVWLVVVGCASKRTQVAIDAIILLVDIFSFFFFLSYREAVVGKRVSRVVCSYDTRKKTFMMVASIAIIMYVSLIAWRRVRRVLWVECVSWWGFEEASSFNGWVDLPRVCLLPNKGDIWFAFIGPCYQYVARFYLMGWWRGGGERGSEKKINALTATAKKKEKRKKVGTINNQIL